MANTYYDSQLTAAEIEAALEAINGLIVPANNGKVIAINNGKFEARSVQWGGGAPVVQPLTVTQNGIYTAPSGVDGYSPITVNVSGGGGGDIPLIQKAAWDAMTTAQKQSYGLVAIQSYNSGYVRGLLVNGAEYMPTFIPYSNGNIIAEANWLNQLTPAGTVFEWGDNILTEEVSKLADGTILSMSRNYSTNIPISVVLPSVSGSFTAYIVAKRVDNTNNRLIMSFGNENEATAGGLGLLFDMNYTVTLSQWADDTSFSTRLNQWKYNDFICAALSYDLASQKSKGFVLRDTKIAFDKLEKNRGTRSSSRVVVGKTFPVHSSPNTDTRTNINVAYLGVVDSADTDQQVLDNLVNIANNVELGL